MLLAIALFVCLAATPTVTSDATFQQYVELMFQFDSVFETLCLVQTNDSVQARRMVEANQDLQTCVNLHHDPQNFTNALDSLTVENRKDFISYNCDQFEEIKKCYHPFTRQLEICFTERDVSMIKTLIMLEEEFAYICEQDGANVQTVARSNYSYCAGNLQELLQNCSMLEWVELRSKTIDTMTERDC
uniref:Protein TsetseEP domain-containing protein n=1 Tax=Anopheles maculatus TaxID=74869 RepID=A0A182SXW9_9DIPT